MPCSGQQYSCFWTPRLPSCCWVQNGELVLIDEGCRRCCLVSPPIGQSSEGDTLLPRYQVRTTSIPERCFSSYVVFLWQLRESSLLLQLWLSKASKRFFKRSSPSPCEICLWGMTHDFWSNWVDGSEHRKVRRRANAISSFQIFLKLSE